MCVYEGGIGLYDSESGKTLDQFEIPTKGVYDVDVSPDGSYAVAASADELARVFEFEEIVEEEDDEDDEEEEEDDDEEYEDEESEDDDEE